MKTRFPAALTLCLLLPIAISAFARNQHRRSGHDSAGKFDYYLLSLSWAPTYCADHPNDNSAECRHGRYVGFVLHGLWPQSQRGAPPQDCRPYRPVSQQTVRRMLAYFPSAGLVQHEWAKHGACSGLSADEYFRKAEQAFRSVQVPEEYKNLDHPQTFAKQEVEQNFADANHAPTEAFRIACHTGELVALEVCMSQTLQFQACTQSVRECPTSQVRMRPPQ